MIQLRNFEIYLLFFIYSRLIKHYNLVRYILLLIDRDLLNSIFASLEGEGHRLGDVNINADDFPKAPISRDLAHDGILTPVV